MFIYRSVCLCTRIYSYGCVYISIDPHLPVLNGRLPFCPLQRIQRHCAVARSVFV